MRTEIISTRLPIVVYIGILIVVGVVGNAVVLFIFTRYFKHSTYRVFVRTLATVDLLICVSHMPLEILYLLEPFGFYNNSSCKTYRYLAFCVVYTSIFLILLIAIERYIKICLPMANVRLSTELSSKFAGVATFLAMIVAIPAIFTNGNHAVIINNVTFVSCSIDDKNYNHTYLISLYTFIGVMYFLATIVLVYAYASIIRTIRKRKINKHGEQPSNLSIVSSNMTRISESTSELQIHTNQSGSENNVHLVRTTRTLIIITVIFVLVHAPFFALAMLVAVDISYRDNLSSISLTMYDIGIRLYLINNVVNPLVYGFTDLRFQRACRSVYRKCFCGNQVGQHP